MNAETFGQRLSTGMVEGATGEFRDRMTRVLLDYHYGHGAESRLDPPLTRATREEWIARFREIVGPRGYEFEGRPEPGSVIRLWRGTELEEHRDGLSWTPHRETALAFARLSSDPRGQLWRIDNVPLHAILYHQPVWARSLAVPEILIDTTGLSIEREPFSGAQS